jgi:hypothetical protein
MSISVRRGRTTWRPMPVQVTAGVLGFLGLSALGGAASMLTGLGAPPAAWLDALPFVDSWLLPGLVLGLGFGAGSLVTAHGMLRRPQWSWLRAVQELTGRHWSWLATLLLGLGQVLWIALEVIYLPELSVLQIVYAAVGFTLLLLPLHRQVRDYLAAPGSR